MFVIFIFACKSENKKYDPENTPAKEEIKKAQADSIKSIKAPEKASFYKKLNNEIRYHIYDYHPKNSYPDIGDVLFMDLKYFYHDSLVYSSALVPDDFKMRLRKPSYPGSIYTGFLQLHEKDSAEFIIKAGDFFKKTRKLVKIPEGIKPNDSLRFFVRLIRIKPESKYLSELENKYEERRKVENSDIKKYIIKKELNPEVLDDRIRREIHVKGSGKRISENSAVKIHYTGLFLNDKVFSDTRSDKKPFTFRMGQEQVIQGLEKGLLDVKKGSKLTLIIPFEEAYGHEKQGPIAPYSTLVFRIEVIDVK